MKIPYSFSILRYVHDVVTGEFVNVGVVLFAPTARFLDAKCTSRYGRLSSRGFRRDLEERNRSAQFIVSNACKELIDIVAK